MSTHTQAALPGLLQHTSARPQDPSAFGHVLHKIFEARAEAWPEALAVIFGQQQETYGELDRRANRLARHLRRRGVRSGSVAGMLLPRSIDAYATILAILKAGAAYVPVDPEYPADRIAYILADSGAGALVTTAELAVRHAAFRGAVICVDADRSRIATESSAALSPEQFHIDSQDLCYVIYTSGSTGRPKGVMVEHRNACHLVCTEGRLFGVRPEDRVYQGASLSFDLSIEEIWLAFCAGATLVAATPELAHAGPDLARRLAECGVTVLSCVPTLLSMLEEDVPTLRLLILGGETCSNQLVARWWRAGRRIVNTYGPTETTVIATYTDAFPDKPVTIGRPVPGYRVFILDSELRPVRHGEVGEICVGGAGVARGYVGLPAETELRFVTALVAGSRAVERIYRTGDLGRVDSEGNIEFLGRADSQVKLRGLRVELSEIESVLMEVDEVLTAGCTVRENESGVAQLVAYVVPRDGVVVDEERLCAHARTRLPAWMAPALIENVQDLPLLATGKLDRVSLPAPQARRDRCQASAARPRTPTEERLMEDWANLFRPLKVSLDSDFFCDLGGHSLLAAQMVSALRKEQRFAALTMLDVYHHPTITQLAGMVDSAAPQSCPPSAIASAASAAKNQGDDCERRRYFLAGVMQAVCLYPVFAFQGLPWLTPYVVYFLLAVNHPVLHSAAWAAASAVAIFPILVLLAVSAKWLLLGRIRSGRHPLWGGYYLRWWFVDTLMESVPLTRLGGTPLLPFVYRLLGVRIGKDVHIATSRLAAFDLISIGDGASVDEGASLLGCSVQDGELVIGPVCVGRECFVGTRSVLGEHVILEDGSRLEDLSLLSNGGRIPPGETWAGSPARRISGAELRDRPPARGPIQRKASVIFYAAIVLAFPLIELLAFVPGVAILIRSGSARALFCVAAPLAGASFMFCLTGEIVVLKWLLIGRARAGTYAVHGWFYVRNWIVEQLLALSVESAGPIYATLHIKPWYRALGVKLGKFAELSTASGVSPDLLEIEEDGTIADEVSLGAARVEGGWLTLLPTRLGRRVFVGNNAVIPAGTDLGEESLVGLLTIAPSDRSWSTRRGASWLGSPPILLPRRQPSAAFSERKTFRPSRKLEWARCGFELLRITLPGAGFIMITVAVLDAAGKLWKSLGAAMTLALLPTIFGAFCIAAIIAVAIVKWIVVGRYRPFEKPFWSLFVWRLEFVNALFEFFATPIALEAFQGTPFLPWYLRLLGARIGRGVYIGSTGFLEFDLVEIGDRSILNKECILQTHLFEDRVLKGSKLRVGAGCEIGTQSVVLYDTEMEEGARLGPLSLLMKGETLPAGSVWVGSPLASATTPTLAEETLSSKRRREKP
ncbi:MAG: Pls/PosA family non-ribosomal peptide synthetase [Bryobacteraceae bacterium]